MKTKNIILLHVYGQSAFNSGDIIAYGSLENLMASDTLSDVPNREKSLTQLWEAASMIAGASSTEGEDSGEENDAERG